MHAVVVTGLGACTSLGPTARATFEAALAGRSGVRTAPELANGSTVPLIAPARFDAYSIAMRQRGAPLDRGTALALAAARQAVDDAADAPLFEADPRLGVYWGTSMGGVETMEDGYRTIFAARQWRLKPTTVVSVMINAPAACISIDQLAAGPALTYSVACASSAIAIGEAVLAIRSGRVDRAIAGGSEAMLTAPALCAWSALRTLATTDAADPAQSCKPFSTARSGFVLGEGAAALVLESAERALARGAHVYGVVAGYGVTSDAGHIADPSTHGQSRAMVVALDDAGLRPEEIGYINAHGTATVTGDRTEVLSIRHALGACAAHVPISSTKAVHGHVMGATGAIEFLIALMALESRSIPPTAHLDSPDPQLDVDLVRGAARHDVGMRAVMSNSFAFGGTNAVLIARVMPDAATASRVR